MDLQNRCPECGKRLKTNYCDICMRKVPFGGVKRETKRDPWERKDGSSAHRMEKDHECITFEKKKPAFPKPLPTASSPKQMLQILAIILACITAISTVIGITEGMTGAEQIAAPEPAANVTDGFVAAGDPGAENAPKVEPGEIYNEDGVRVTVDAAGLSYGDYTIFLTIYNDTDHNISVTGDQLSVNSYMFSYSMYQDVKAGRSEQTRLTFYDFELEKAGIKKVGNVEFILNIYDEYSYENTRKLVAIETDAPVEYGFMTTIAGRPLYNSEDLTVILQDISLDGAGDCQLDLYMQNHSQNTINLYSGAVWVNGEEVSGYLWQMLRPNTCAMNDMYIYELDERVDLDIQSLGQVEEISIELYVEILDDLELLEVFSETVTFEPTAIQVSKGES